MDEPIQFKVMTPINISHKPFNPEKNWEFLLVWVNIFQKEWEILEKRTKIIFLIVTHKLKNNFNDYRFYILPSNKFG